MCMVGFTELEEDSDSEEINDEDESGKSSRKRPLESEVTEGDDGAGPSTSQKRQKLESSVVEEAANTSQSLRHLKKMYAAKVEKKVVTEVVSRDGDGILSNEDFQRIRDLQVISGASFRILQLVMSNPHMMWNLVWERMMLV